MRHHVGSAAAIRSDFGHRPRVSLVPMCAVQGRMPPPATLTRPVPGWCLSFALAFGGLRCADVPEVRRQRHPHVQDVDDAVHDKIPPHARWRDGSAEVRRQHLAHVQDVDHLVVVEVRRPPVVRLVVRVRRVSAGVRRVGAAYNSTPSLNPSPSVSAAASRAAIS